jgi:hypothetical protein
MSLRLSTFLNGRVVVAVLVQTAGHAALLALFSDGDPSAVVETLAGVPPYVLIPPAIPAIPATLLAIAAGAALSAVGLPPESIPAIAFARGDVLVFTAAYAVGVAAAWVDDRTTAPS